MRAAYKLNDARSVAAAVAFGLIMAFACTSVWAGDGAPWYRFGSEFKMIWPIGFNIEPLPWAEDEKTLVHNQLAEIERLAPGLVQRVSAYRPLLVYRGGPRSDGAAAIALPSHNALLLGEGAFKKIPGRNVLLSSILHEITHLVDSLEKIALGERWQALIKPRIKKVHRFLAEAGTPLGSQPASRLQAKYPDLAASAGLPTVYSAGNEQEALAEITTHTAYGSYKPPAEIEAYIEEQLFATPYRAESDVGFMHQGASLHIEGKLREGFEAYNRAVGANPALKIIYLFRGQLLEDARRWDKAAIDYLYVHESPRLTNYRKAIRWRLSVIYPKLRANKVRLPVLVELLDEHPDSLEYRHNYADVLEQMDRCEQAMPEYEVVIKSGVNAYLGRGKCRAKQSDFVGAISDYDRAAAGLPYPSPGLMLLRGIAKYRAGYHKEAISDLKGAKKMPSLVKEADQWLAKINRGD